MSSAPSRLKQLAQAGQAVWLDFVERGFLQRGGLRKLIEEDGVTGVTSNPSIFEKSMGQGNAYDAGFRDFLQRSDAPVVAVYESQAIADIKAAAADLRGVYDRLGGKDGYVSLEVSPYLAHGTGDTIEEARRLWREVAEPNLMIKVPGTTAGAPAIRTLIAEGINVNVTLLFSIEAYRAVALAYLEGLEARLEQGQSIDRIASVASFFVSRIDTQIDKTIDARLKAGDPRASALSALRGKVAIANAKLAYAEYQRMIAGDRWRALAARGAQPQRLLWASTGTKDPSYPDTLYVDTLIGPDTVNTMPPKTMDAFRDHGRVAPALTAQVDDARQVIAEVDRLGLDLDAVTRDLVEEGVRQFADAADGLLAEVATKRSEILGARLDSLELDLPEDLARAVATRLEQARAEAWSRRLWKADASLWTGKDESRWLGWLDAATGRQVDVAALASLAAKARSFPAAVLLGMGGSSLGPEVLSRLLGGLPGHPALHVLDTTDPDQIATVESRIDPTHTLFIVSSKSGSTMEPELLRAYFFEKSGRRGDHFVAVTDPGSALEAVAHRDRYASLFHGDPAIGGRYSVLSAFGMVPAAAMGLDVAAFFESTRPMVHSCGPDVPPARNPGVQLGVALGEAARAGRDKVTIVAPGRLAPFGAWLEQLIAESTGKNGKGIVPVDLEPLGALPAYGTDRVFVHLALGNEADVATRLTLAQLRAAGHPVITLTLADPSLVGQEFFRWEIATAVAGAVIGIDPFDQPDVEEAKVATRRLVDAFERTGAPDAETPVSTTADFEVFGDGHAASLRDLFASLRPGDYVGFLAYLERDDEHEATLAAMRQAVRDATRNATVAGFGPRFLHSTGQAYKGGPGTGVFLTITREPEADLAIPGRRVTFGAVQEAQARGDTQVLAARGRRVLRVRLKQAGKGLAALKAAVLAAL